MKKLWGLGVGLILFLPGIVAKILAERPPEQIYDWSLTGRTIQTPYRHHIDTI